MNLHACKSSPMNAMAAYRSITRIPMKRIGGFTLIELMIALVLGLLVTVAISTLFLNTGRANREQASIARMQENGRYALGRMVADLRMAGQQYCTGYSNLYQQGPNHIMRPLTVLTNVSPADGLQWGLPSRATVQPAVAGTSPWPLSPRYFLQGHECGTGTCVPATNVLGSVLPQLPVIGTAANQRANRADAITVRYLATAGIPLAVDHANGVTPLVTTAPVTLAAGELAMVANCSVAEVFSAVAGGNSVTPSGNINDTLREYSRANDSRVFNFSRDMRTVSYFLGMRANVDGGPSISTLVRRENNISQNLADGVERLELLYGVDAPLIITAPGVPDVEVMRTYWLTATQVQNGVSPSGAALICLRRPEGLSANEPGCLWRSVHTIDVGLLVNSVSDDAPNATQLFSFSAASPPIVAQVATTLPSGLPPGRKFRKEFRTRVNLRNFTN